MSTTYPKIIAVDFDGCLCKSKWPDIGEPNELAINELKYRKRTGCEVILWTCRAGEQLEKAVAWCKEQGLVFDAVNDNLPRCKEYFGNDTRKVFANEYWDDKSVFVSADDNAVYQGLNNLILVQDVLQKSGPIRSLKRRFARWKESRRKSQCGEKRRRRRNVN